ncbi:phenylacetate--CoA ligase [Desulfovibrio sp. OttesenSCG-928-F07]|nr:phenylacetate--CoA ligase [Desulfovibrio sp. OttesenSCG-928-F07]
MKEQQFIPKLSKDEINHIQTNGLKWTVEHAVKNSPQYRAKFKEAGINPADVTSLDDLQKLPLTTTEDLRAGYPLPLLSVPQNEVVRIHASSGTTGKRKILAYSKNDVDTFSLQMARCYELAGLTTNDIVQVAVGYGLWTAGAGFQLGSEKYGTLTVPVGAGNLDIHLQMLTDLGTTCLGCTASMGLLMGEEVTRHKLKDKLKLKYAIFGAEGHSPKMRKTFEEQLGLEHSFNIGGMTEMYGPGTSLECRRHEGLHYWADLFIIEILDPETLKPVAPGEVGEMVVTSLRKEASPLIRYRTRDLSRLLTGDCDCGCTMPRHDHLLGRSDDMIIFRGVNIYPGQIAEVLHGFEDIGSEYHLVLSRKEARDNMLLKVELAKDKQLGAEEIELLKPKLAKAVHTKLLISCEVEVVSYGDLPRSFGKTKRVTDERFL